MADTLELPDEVTEALKQSEVTGPERLAKLANTISTKRAAAIAARKESGIEDVWMKAEEAYLGIDDMNRSTFAAAKWAKPTSMSGPLTATSAISDASKSDAYVRLTSRYVDAGAAKLADITLPADEKAFKFSSTPVPEMVSKLKDTSQAIHNGVPLERDAPTTPGAAAVPPGSLPAAPDAAKPPAAPGPLAPGIPITVKDLAEEAIARAQESAKKAETRIYDWMVQSQYRAEMRKVMFDGARIGVGILKAPFPRRQVVRAMDSTTKRIKTHSKVSPAYEWKCPWSIYPDPACGENIRNGDHLFELEPNSAKQLRKLKGLPGYIDSAIDAVLTIGPTGQTPEGQKPYEKTNKHRFLVWHFYGTITREDMIAAGGLKADEEAAEEVYAIVTMVDDTIIRATLNPLDSGEIPYHAFPWQRRAGFWAGVGVGEQLEMPQRAINAAIRSLFNNAGKSAGSIIVVDRGAITPADGSWVITPDKLFYKNAEATSDDVNKAFATFQVPNQGPALMALIELCLRLAEEVTNIPLVTQGQSGTTTPETFGATQLQNNNANQLLRSIGYAVDDYITEPVVNDSYEYLLLDPDTPEEEKGDWHIDAHGSSAMVERAIQDQTIQQMGQFAVNPAFGVDPKKWFAEFAKTKKLNPLNFQYSPEEQAKRDAIPPVPAPAVQAAQIRVADAKEARALEKQLADQNAQLEERIKQAANESKETIAAMRKEVEELRVLKDRDRDTVYVQAETARTTNEHTARMQELAAKERLAILEYANKREMKLADVKKELAKTEMTLQVQRELSSATAAAKPAAEPAGKAPKGQSFTK